MAELKVDIDSASPECTTSLHEATRWTAAERREFGTDRTPSGEKIKRPMNAFMVWAQIRRAEITATSAKVHNSLISKALGQEWKTMTEEQKAPYAKQLRDELFREHPNYVYRPRKRKRNNDPAVKASPPRTLSPADRHSGSEQTSPLSSKSTESDFPGINLSPLLLYPPFASLLPALQQNPVPTLNPLSINPLHPNPLLLNQLLYTQMLAAVLPQH